MKKSELLKEIRNYDKYTKDYILYTKSQEELEKYLIKLKIKRINLRDYIQRYVIPGQRFKVTSMDDKVLGYVDNGNSKIQEMSPSLYDYLDTDVFSVALTIRLKVDSNEKI